MRRRQFIAGLGSAAAWPLAVHAQQADRMRRIGVLMGSDENDPAYKRVLNSLPASRVPAATSPGWQPPPMTPLLVPKPYSPRQLLAKVRQLLR